MRIIVDTEEAFRQLLFEVIESVVESGYEQTRLLNEGSSEVVPLGGTFEFPVHVLKVYDEERLATEIRRAIPSLETHHFEVLPPEGDARTTSLVITP